MISHNTCSRPIVITPGYQDAWIPAIALLHALQLIVHASKTAGKPVTVCGEMANDPGCALLLLGMGFDGLSISATAIPRVKWAIRSVSSACMKTLAEQALQLDRPERVHCLWSRHYRLPGLNSFIYRNDETHANCIGAANVRNNASQ